MPHRSYVDSDLLETQRIDSTVHNEGVASSFLFEFDENGN